MILGAVVLPRGAVVPPCEAQKHRELLHGTPATKCDLAFADRCTTPHIRASARVSCEAHVARPTPPLSKPRVEAHQQGADAPTLGVRGLRCGRRGLRRRHEVVVDVRRGCRKGRSLRRATSGRGIGCTAGSREGGLCSASAQMERLQRQDNRTSTSASRRPCGSKPTATRKMQRRIHRRSVQTSVT